MKNNNLQHKQTARKTITLPLSSKLSLSELSNVSGGAVLNEHGWMIEDEMTAEERRRATWMK